LRYFPDLDSELLNLAFFWQRLEVLEGHVNIDVDWEAYPPQQHDAVAACVLKGHKFKLVDAVVVGEEVSDNKVELQFDAGHHIQWVNSSDVFPLLDAIALPVELTVGSTVQESILCHFHLIPTRNLFGKT